MQAKVTHLITETIDIPDYVNFDEDLLSKYNKALYYPEYGEDEEEYEITNEEEAEGNKMLRNIEYYLIDRFGNTIEECELKSPKFDRLFLLYEDGYRAY